MICLVPSPIGFLSSFVGLYRNKRLGCL